MIRHISVFTFLDEPKNGATKAENIAAVREYLEKVPELYPAIRQNVVASAVGSPPPLPDDATVMFGDLIQIIDFDSPEDAGGYPPSAAHTGLVALSDPMMKKVTGIDFEV